MNGLIIQWGKKLIDGTGVLTASFSLLFSSMPYVVINPIRVSSDGFPQGDVRIRNFTLSGTSYNGFNFQLTNSKEYTNGATAFWIAIGY